ncbi:MAG: amino acid transporter permease [Sporomusa sp.]|jgi:L-cystine transport system permease protein|nr:amino acid transporter permease [Sporomusa sp.]
MRPFNPQFILDVIPNLLPFLWVTLAVVLGTVFFGSLLGFVLSWAKLSQKARYRWLADGYIYIIRCTPSIVLLFIIFYGLPKFWLEVLDTDINDYDKIFFVLVTFTLLFAAPISEVMRSAYEAIDHGQYEAAVSIGLTPWQAFYHIVLPQATVVALPNFGNSVIELMKEGSLAYTIGLIDLIGKGQLIISQNYGAYALETYLSLSFIYLLLTLGVEKSFLRLEHVFSRQKKVV